MSLRPGTSYKDLRNMGGLNQRLKGLNNLPRTKIRFSRCCVVGKQVLPVSWKQVKRDPSKKG